MQVKTLGNRFILLLSTLLCCALLSSVTYADDHISTESFENLPTSKRLLLDVRSVKEYSKGHIPSSVNMPLEEITSSIERLSEFKDFPIIVYCEHGERASKAITMLVNNGFTNVKHLQGDMLEWTREQRAVNSLN
ncbi:rhodanese-like domain-containing protein [Glaciecola sp. MH2013]|uniref:rhodanese-like domain-containing protein n=1 Tax=Glaciecola sp. MH2013 TaxID=2785524 RepID=UPI0018A0B419|nr:rhodanese-like domain-containing protein [Glaciecola sp. MH2013]MBF7074935.1 rhodanese-like domain-containing protein [Glaciecola sp. MH2013]